MKNNEVREKITCPHCISDVPYGASVCRGCQSEIHYGNSIFSFLIFLIAPFLIGIQPQIMLIDYGIMSKDAHGFLKGITLFVPLITCLAISYKINRYMYRDHISFSRKVKQ